MAYEDRDDELPGAPPAPPPPPPGAPPSDSTKSSSSSSTLNYTGSGPGVWGGAKTTGDFGMKSRYPDAFGIGGDMSKTISDYLKGVIGGKDLPYGPEQIAALTAQAKANSEGAAKGSIDAATQDAIRRGVFRSPAALRQVTDIRRNADTSFGREATNIRLTAAKENFSARMAALDRAQKWLDSMRDFVARMDSNDAQRQQAIASLQLAYARLSAERDMFAQKMQHDFDLQNSRKVPINIGGKTILVPPELVPIILGGGA